MSSPSPDHEGITFFSSQSEARGSYLSFINRTVRTNFAVENETKTFGITQNIYRRLYQAFDPNSLLDIRSLFLNYFKSSRSDYENDIVYLSY